MKKIFTLVAALLVSANVAKVQAFSETDLPTGYYKIKSCASDGRSYVHMFNDAFGTDVNVTLLSQTTAETNNYVWKITNTGGTTIGIVNGQGTSIKREDGAVGSHKYAVHSSLTPDDANSAYPASVLFTEYLFVTTDDDPNHSYTINGTQYIALAYYNNHKGDNCKWNLEKIDMTDKEVYTVSVTGADNAYVTKTSTDEKAFNGGFFVCSTTPTAADFTSSEVENYQYDITVDASTKAINVAYKVVFSVYQNLINEAKEVLAMKRIGYPLETSTAYATFKAAIDNAETKTAETYTADDVNSLTQAISTFKLSTDNVRMPEDGKAYTITAVSKSGRKSYMNYADAGYSMVETTGNNASYPITAVVVCHKTSDGKYVLVNNAGKFLTFKGNNNAAINDNKGYVNSFDPVVYTNTKTNQTVTLQPQLFTISKVQNGSNVSGLTDAYVSLTAKRANKDNAGSDVNFVIKNVTSYDAANVDFYNDTYSSALLLEEYNYPNTVTFNAAVGIEGADYISTFSAPFATIKPANVKAYIVKGNSGTEATLEEVEGNIPANQGVVLTSTSNAAVTMVPVAGEGTATIENNLLSHTAGAAKTIAEGENVYVLSKAVEASVVAFNKAKVASTLKMNKAYLTAQGGSAIALNFTSGEVTGVSTAIVDGVNDNAPIYDLMGRRVVKMTKGGLYIKGGKKIIAQ